MSGPGSICIESPAAFGIFIPFESASRSCVGQGPTISGLLGALAKLLGAGCKAVGTSGGATGAGTSLGGGLTAGVDHAGTGVQLLILRAVLAAEQRKESWRRSHRRRAILDLWYHRPATQPLGRDYSHAGRWGRRTNNPDAACALVAVKKTILSCAANCKSKAHDCDDGDTVDPGPFFSRERHWQFLGRGEQASGTNPRVLRGRITLDHVNHLHSRSSIIQLVKGLFEGRHPLLARVWQPVGRCQTAFEHAPENCTCESERRCGSAPIGYSI